MSATKLIPLGNRVIVREIPTETYRGLRTPQATDEEHTQEHEIVAFPDAGVAHLSISLGIGSRVYVARHKRLKISTNSGEELYAVETDDILAIEVDAARSFEPGNEQLSGGTI